MGIHALNQALMADDAIDPLRPEILLYVPKANGKLELVGVEYWKRDADGSYLYPVVQDPPGCPAGLYHVLGFTARFTVTGKGELDLAVPGSPQCLSQDDVLEPTYPPITITGGSGVYAGASGTGTLTHDAHSTDLGAAGTDTWVGTLVVPGLDFDLTAPTLTGAVDKTVRAPRRAKRARVT